MKMVLVYVSCEFCLSLSLVASKNFFIQAIVVLKKVVLLQHLSNQDVERETGPSSAVLAFYKFLIFFN